MNMKDAKFCLLLMVFVLLPLMRCLSEDQERDWIADAIRAGCVAPALGVMVIYALMGFALAEPPVMVGKKPLTCYQGMLLFALRGLLLLGLIYEAIYMSYTVSTAGAGIWLAPHGFACAAMLLLLVVTRK